MLKFLIYEQFVDHVTLTYDLLLWNVRITLRAERINLSLSLIQ